MIPTLRRQTILNLLQENDVLMLPDIVCHMGISESTIRRDLKELASSGQVELLRGGGVRMHKENIELHIEAKLLLNKDAKDKIARTAAKMVYPGDVIFLDPSSANNMLIDYLETDRITVVTNSVLHINKLLKANIDCMLIGGQVKPSTGSCLGSLAEQTMRSLRFTKAFLGANGISTTMGITNHDPSEQAIKRLAIDMAVSSFFLVDSSKYGVVTMCKVADIDECTIITDQPIEALSAYPNVLTAGDEPEEDDEE